MPKWEKVVESQLPKAEVLHHVSGERPYNRGIFINSCPNCGIELPASVRKRLELGYRVYCPTQGCFYPLFTLTTLQEGAFESAEPPKIKEKVPKAPKDVKIQEKIPKAPKDVKIEEKASKPSKTQGAAPSQTTKTPKSADSKHCPHCGYPLSNNQLKKKKIGNKVMCRNCSELI